MLEVVRARRHNIEILYPQMNYTRNAEISDSSSEAQRDGVLAIRAQPVGVDAASFRNMSICGGHYQTTLLGKRGSTIFYAIHKIFATN
jgi:hypothetical protein